MLRPAGVTDSTRVSCMGHKEGTYAVVGDVFLMTASSVRKHIHHMAGSRQNNNMAPLWRRSARPACERREGKGVML
ncbi:hypothetical protein EYF80_003919 [Liparis tanakae]|uniref:Uncharacterized protein n=1 Tax=Liparis tanakae TaxID=230148 RepID=A0A4Z2J892_9TELE|nr:hypothetical protein EYF80_003919 [Liparis tanakae]